MRRLRTFLLVAAAFGAGLFVQRALTPIAPADVHLSGDGSPQIADALFAWPGPPRARDPARAALEVVTFRRWQNVATMTALMRACGAACGGSAPVVLLRRPSPGGLGQVLFVDLSAFGAGPALDAGTPMAEADVACVTAVIGGVLGGRPEVDPACATPDVRTVWRPRLRAP